MILELGEGRELQLPDEMSDESARMIKRLILVCEERAATAEAQVRMLQDEMAAMRKQFEAVQAQGNEAQAYAIRELHTSLGEGIKKIVAAVRADRVMVPNEFGEYTRSKVA